MIYYFILEHLIIVKFGGSALGIDGVKIPVVIRRIKELNRNAKIVCVFSAPLTHYEGRNLSMTDVAIRVSRNYASLNPVDIDILKEVYLKISDKCLPYDYRQKFESDLEKFTKIVLVSLKQVAENRRFVDVSRSRILAYSGEIVISCLMNYILKSNDVNSESVSVGEWPIVTDDNFEAANFMLDESKKHLNSLVDLLECHDVLCIGGFIGKTIDGLETTYERGGSDRTAADLGILLSSSYDVLIDFEKDNVVLSADPRIISDNLQYVDSLSYNEAKLAGMFGMKILDPVAIKDIDDNNLDIPIVITNISDPGRFTKIKKQISLEEMERESKIKIVTGKRNCVIVRMESIAASHLVALLEKQRQYHDFVKLSPYRQDNYEITRFLFLDANYVKRHEKIFRSFHSKAEMVYARCVVIFIGYLMW